MGQIIKSPNGKWTFEHFTSNNQVTITSPAILLTVEPLTKETDSNFPYKITYGYYMDNPYSLLNDNPPFRLFETEEIFILKKEYSDDIESNLIKDLKALKSDFDIRIFGLKSEL